MLDSSKAFPGRIPRFVLAAASSGAGKTSLAIGLIAALRRRGHIVAAAKAGPDFLDTAHLSRVSGRAARNVDPWLGPESFARRSFVRGSADADVSVIEGVMGLFDGRHGSGEGSTAHVARILDAPVVLVLDCARASATIGAVAYGLARFDPRVRVAGAILNRVASDRHAATVCDAVRAAGVAVLGVVRRDERVALASRHLGLVEPSGEEWSRAVDALADAMEEGVDLDALLAAAHDVAPLTCETAPVPRAADVRVAVARDEAFWFYDEASLDALRDAGAELVPYAPLRDPFPADAHAAYIGGGYPELHAAALARNVAGRDGLRRAIASGMPAYAECGGLMYLGEMLETVDGAHAMVGAIPATSTMSERREALRYVEAEALGDGPLFAAGEIVRGHEFHYSRTRYARTAHAYAIDGEREGFLGSSAHASYVHVHLGAYPAAAERFVARARVFAGVR